MLALSMIDDIERCIRGKLTFTKYGRGNVGRRVQISTILLLHNHGSFVAIEEDANRATALDSQRSR